MTFIVTSALASSKCRQAPTVNEPQIRPYVLEQLYRLCVDAFLPLDQLSRETVEHPATRFDRSCPIFHRWSAATSSVWPTFTIPSRPTFHGCWNVGLDPVIPGVDPAQVSFSCDVSSILYLPTMSSHIDVHPATHGWTKSVADSSRGKISSDNPTTTELTRYQKTRDTFIACIGGVSKLHAMLIAGSLLFSAALKEEGYTE